MSANPGGDHRLLDGSDDAPSAAPFRTAAAAREAFGAVLLSDIKSWIDRGTSVWRKDTSNYTEEVAIVRDLAKPLLWGVGVTFFTFGTFRVSGSVWFQTFKRKQMAWLRSSGTDATATTTAGRSSRGTAAGTMRSSPMSGSRTTRGDRLLSEQDAAAKQDLGTLPMDILLSFVLGMSSTAFLIEPQEVAQKVGRIPLVSGKSVISDVSCDKWRKDYYARVPWKEFRAIEERQEENVLRTLRDFVHHCHVRDHAKRIVIAQQQQRLMNATSGVMFDDDEQSERLRSEAGTPVDVAIPREVMDQAMNEIAAAKHE